MLRQESSCLSHLIHLGYMKNMKFSRLRTKLPFWLALLVCSVILVGITFPQTYDQLWNTETDFYQHAQDADLILIDDFENWYPIIGHPLWHLCTVGLYELGMGSDYAGASVTTAMKLAQMLIICCFFDRMLRGKISRVWSPILALATVLVSAVWIPSINPQIYVNAGSPNVWHSPTQTMVLFWMLLCVMFLSASYERQLRTSDKRCDFTWYRMLFFAVCLAISTIAKPVFVQSFFPGAAAYFLFQWIRNPRHTRYYIRILLSLIPTIALILLQLGAYYGEEAGTGLLLFFNPDQILYTLRIALMINAFPVFVILTNPQKQKNVFSSLCIFTFVAACLECAFIRETGMRSTHGNFDWALMATSLLIWVNAVPQFIEMLREKRSAKTLAAGIVASGLFVWHLASGIFYLYMLYTTSNWF